MRNDGKQPDEVKCTLKRDGVTQNEPAPAPYARKRKNLTGHRILSRHPRQALVSAGENAHALDRIERSLRDELRPTGVIGQIIFDRLLSCVWRCLLIAKKEKTIFVPENQPGTFEERLEQARQSHMLALAAGDSKSGYNQASILLSNLSITQRYDAHYSRELYRALGMLLTLRGAGDTELTLLLAKTFGQNRENIAAEQ